MNSHRKTIQLLLTSFSILCVFNSCSEIASSKSTIYHADPDHLWNRLNKTLFMRTAQDGKNYGLNRVDILYWSTTKHLLEESSHQQALTVLDEFIETHGETLVQDPLKRALLQRDLWQLFDWSERQTLNYAQEREELQKRLAIAIRRLALSTEEIATLPDNYEQAKAEQLPDFPQDLFQTDGDWVNLGITSNEMIAPEHIRGVSGHSVFNVMVQLPNGRQSTLSYLENLREYQPENIREVIYSARSVSDPIIPHFPVNTQWALIRRMCVIDDKGNIQPTAIIEEIQIRRYLEIKIMNPVSRDAQQFFQFQMDRQLNGALRAIGENEKDFNFLPFRSLGIDRFERSPRNASMNTPQDSSSLQSPVLQTCYQCHNAAGIFSINSYTRFLSSPASGSPSRTEPAKLFEFEVNNEAELTIDWKQDQSNWKLLQQFWRNADNP